MTRLPQTSLSADSFYATLGHRPEIKAAWENLDTVLLRDPSSLLSPGLKEEARLSLASGVDCRYCSTVAGDGKPADTDPRASLVSAFAAQVVASNGSIDDEVFDVLREEFSVEEIVELCAWICFKFGANVLGALVALEPASEDQIATYRDVLDTAAAQHAGSTA